MNSDGQKNFFSQQNASWAHALVIVKRRFLWTLLHVTGFIQNFNVETICNGIDPRVLIACYFFIIDPGYVRWMTINWKVDEEMNTKKPCIQHLIPHKLQSAQRGSSTKLPLLSIIDP